MASPSSDTPGFTQPNNAPSTSQAAAPSTSPAAAPAPATSSSPAPQAESSAVAPSSSSAAGPATTEQQQQPQPTTSAAQGGPQSSSSQAAASSSNPAGSTPAGAVTVTSTLPASASSSSVVTENTSSSAAVAVSTVTVSSSSSASSTPAVPTTTSSTPPAPTATLRSGSVQSTSSSTLGSTGSRASNGTDGSSRSLSAGAIGGIAGGAVGLLLLLGMGVWAYRRRKARKDRDEWPLPYSPPRDMIAASGTGYGGGWDDKPTAGAGVASSSNLGYSGEKPGFSRSNSALYVPGLPAHYPSYGRRTSQRPLSPSSSGPSTPGLGPAYSYDQPLAPMMMPAMAGQGQNQYRPASPAQQQGGTGDFAQGPFLFQHDRSPGGSAVGSASGSRSSTPIVRGGMAGGSNSDLRGEGVMQGSSGDVASGRRLPPPIQTTGLNDVSGPANGSDNLGGSAPSTPRSSSRHSYNPQHASQGYAQPYYPSSANTHHSWSNPGSGLRTSYSGRSVHLQMPTPLDPSTSRQGYLSPPTSPRPGSTYGLNEFGAYGNPGVARSSRPGSGSGSGSRGSGSYSPSRDGSVHSSTRLQGRPFSSGLAGEANGHGVSHQPSTSSSLASGPSGSGEGEEEVKRES